MSFFGQKEGRDCRPHAVPERRPNLWAAVLGLVAYALVASVVLWLAIAIVLALQP